MPGTLTIELKSILEERGLTQQQLSEMTGIRPTRISQICRGFVDRLELDHIVKISDALQLQPWAWIVYTSDWMLQDDTISEDTV